MDVLVHKILRDHSAPPHALHHKVVALPPELPGVLVVRHLLCLTVLQCC